MVLYRCFRRKEQPVVPALSVCEDSSLSRKELEETNDRVSLILCHGEGESAKLTPRGVPNTLEYMTTTDTAVNLVNTHMWHTWLHHNFVFDLNCELPNIKFAKYLSKRFLAISPNLMATKISQYNGTRQTTSNLNTFTSCLWTKCDHLIGLTLAKHGLLRERCWLTRQSYSHFVDTSAGWRPAYSH